MNKKLNEAVKNLGKVTAGWGDEYPCTWFLGQPKMPKCLAEKEMKKDAE